MAMVVITAVGVCSECTFFPLRTKALAGRDYFSKLTRFDFEDGRDNDGEYRHP